MKEIEKIWNLFDRLCSSYQELPETEEAYLQVEKSVENGAGKAEVLKHVQNYATDSEKQGFIYGFRYAAALLMEVMCSMN